MTTEQVREIQKCSNGADGAIHFIRTYCKIKDETQPERGWFDFDLWPEQEEIVRKFFSSKRLVALKARQLGLTWLFVALALHEVQFRPGSNVMIFSITDREAKAVFKRLKGMYKHLPEWMQSASTGPNNAHEWDLDNDSSAKCFPPSAGDSYTASTVIIDEADLIDNLEELLSSTEPTINAGGKLILISKSKKSKPNSLFKRIFRAAEEGRNEYTPVFLSWSVRPERRNDPGWYDRQKRDTLANHGSLDRLHENYPTTPEEALAARTLGRRIAREWIESASKITAPIGDDGAPAIPDLRIFHPPVPGSAYVIGGDPAEGNPTSDDSAACVIEVSTTNQWRQVATLAGKLEPSTFADYIKQTAAYYNNAAALIERNNHGHAVLLWLRDNSRVKLIKGEDKRPGWLSSTKGKSTLYNLTAEAIKNSEVEITDRETAIQLASIDGATLRAPEGDNDDRADAFALAVIAALRKPSSPGHVYAL